MATSGGRRGARRSGLPGRDRLREKKERLQRRQAADGVPNGLVEIPGPLPQGAEEEIRALAAAVERREQERDPDALILLITPFQGGLAIETETEKLAQHIADAIAKSRKARVERTYDDEGRRRILRCRFG